MALKALTLPTWMPRLAFAPMSANAPSGDTLIVVFLRGAADALSLIVPHGADDYYAQRPTLAIPRPDDTRSPTAERTRDLDGFFGLHPALAPLLPAWQAEHLAIIHACGAPDESRSHFRAMELMERGVDDERGPASGWIGRHLATRAAPLGAPLRALGLGPAVPRSLFGPLPATALRSIADFHLQGDARAVARMQSALHALYRDDPALGAAGQATLDLLALLDRLAPESAPRPAGPDYPEGDFGRGLRQAAYLIRAEVGLEAAALDLGGWDTHFAQGNSTGLLAERATELGAGLAAFYADLGTQQARVTVVVMSEFGRRVAENGSLGTDHGHGGAMLVLGAHANGGRMHGAWPGLAPAQLVGPGDLAVTTDYRDVLAEICALRLGNAALEAIFPGHRVTPAGVVRA